MARKEGAVPSQMLLQLIKVNAIGGAQEKNVRPASLSLALTDEMYRFEGVVQPRKGESVGQMLTRLNASRHPVYLPLEVGVHYVAKLKERLELPGEIYAYANPKSTAGRTFVHARVLADGIQRFDTAAPGGYTGDLWVLIVSRIFPVQLIEGDSLVQMRFFTADTRLDRLELKFAMNEHHLLWSPDGKLLRPDDGYLSEDDGSLLLSLNVSSGIIGWECMRSNTVLKWSAKGEYQAQDFFRPVQLQGDYVRLRRGSYYILSTHEYVRVPPHLACEMHRTDHRTVDLSTHIAGYIDPGWGFGPSGHGQGRPLTLEVEAYEDDIVLDRSQSVARIKFEQMREEPEQHYDEDNPTYGNQLVAQLARQFKNA